MTTPVFSHTNGGDVIVQSATLDPPRFDGDWEIRRLGDLASFYKGSGLSKKDLVSDGKRRCIHYGQLFTTYGERITTVVSGTDLTGSFFVSRSHDVLMPASDVTPNGLATASCILQSDVILGGDVLIIRPLETLNGEFLAYIIKTNREAIIRLVSGTTVFHLYGRDLSNFCFAAPGIAEQTAIAAVLSDVDGLLDALGALIIKKGIIKKAAMQQLFSGKTRLPGFDREWETIEVNGIGSLFGGLTGKAKVDFGQGDARYVTFLSVLEDTVLNAKHTDYVCVSASESQNTVLKGDLLFNATSETPDDLAMGAVMGAKIAHLYLNSFCFGLRIRDKRKHDPLFLAYLFRSPTGRTTLKALAQGATRYNMSKSQFLKLQIAVPSLSEQQAVAKVLSDMDSEIAALEKRRDKILDMKQGMLQQLLSGRIRLVKPE